jgi:hypothetical protein
MKTIAKLYKITHLPTGLNYYGSVWAKDKTIHDRLNEHLNDRYAGKFITQLITQGALKSDFVTELVMEGDVQYICDMESQLAKNTMWPNGLNGNAGKNIVRTKDGQKRTTAAVSKAKKGKTKATCSGVASQSRILSEQSGDNRTEKQKEWDSRKSEWAKENNIIPPDITLRKTGDKMINDGITQKWSRINDLEQYLSSGWVLGKLFTVSHSEQTKEKMRKPKTKIQCPHCDLIGGDSQMKRWHFDKCKNKQL